VTTVSGGRTLRVEDGGSLWYEVGGDGPAVVLLHAGLWDARAWDRQIDPFTTRFRVLRYDLRGYGRSSRLMPGAVYSNVRDAVAVMDDADIERAALVGNSMGGSIALDLALTFPERVAALVLAAPALGGLEPTAEEDAWFEEHLALAGEALEAGDLERARRLQIEGVWAPLGIDDPDGATILGLAMDNLHELTMDESGAEQLDPPAAGRLHEIGVPTLILPADHDPPFLRRASEVIAAGVAGARVARIADVDHAIAIRATEAFNEIVLGFLDEVV
jgi:3-oxoadipate enol-lactonase